MRLLSGLLSLAILCAPLTAVAGPVEDAQAIKGQADKLMVDLKYEQALTLYDQAYALDPNPALLYNQARALQALGRYPEALSKLEAFVQQAPQDLKAKVPQLEQLVQEVAAKTSTLKLTTNEPGATVTLGGVVLGTTPLPDQRVNAAKGVVLKITKEGFAEETRPVDLPGAGILDLRVELVAKDKTGVLVLESPTPGATVRVDGGAPRQLPTELRVSAGAHVITLSAPDHEDSTVEVLVAATERKRVVLEPVETPVYERWWFWTIGGVILAGGAAAGITAAALTEGSPDSGSIAPGQLTVTGYRVGAPPESPSLAEPRFGSFSVGPLPLVTFSF